MSKRDYYEVLGLARDATEDDIKKAYRKLAAVYHPDRHQDKSEAEIKATEEKFKEVKEAYETLSDTKLRAKYDRNGHAQHDFVDSDDIDFSQAQEAMRAYWRRQQENAVPTIRITAPLKEAYEGRDVPLNVFGQVVTYTLRPGLPQGVSFIDEVMVGDRKRRVHIQISIQSGAFNFVSVGTEDGVKYSGDLETLVEVEAIDVYLGGFFKITDFLGAELQVRVPAGFDTNLRLKVAGRGYSHWIGDKASVRGDLYLRVKPKFTLIKADIEQRLKNA